MNKIDFLEQIETKVKDVAEEITIVSAIKGNGEITSNDTTFPVETTKGFQIGDDVYITDRNTHAVFTKILDVIDSGHLKVEGDQRVFQKGALIKKTDATKYLDEAVALYSKFNPFERVFRITETIPMDIFDLPEDWESGFSKIQHIEFPIGYAKLYETDYEVFQDEDGKYKIRFLYELVSSFIITYTVRHKFDNSNPPESNIPDCDFYCVCNIASGYYLQSLANRFSENVNPMLGSSSINYGNKSETYQKLAIDMFQQAASWLGINLSLKDGFFFEQAPVSSDQKVKYHVHD